MHLSKANNITADTVDCNWTEHFSQGPKIRGWACTSDVLMCNLKDPECILDNYHTNCTVFVFCVPGNSMGTTASAEVIQCSKWISGHPGVARESVKLVKVVWDHPYGERQGGFAPGDRRRQSTDHRASGAVDIYSGNFLLYILLYIFTMCLWF